MKCPICKKELDSAIKIIGPDGYLFHLSVHIRDTVRLAFDLLEEIARNGKTNKYTVSRARRILKERQNIRSAMRKN